MVLPFTWKENWRISPHLPQGPSSEVLTGQFIQNVCSAEFSDRILGAQNLFSMFIA